MNFDGAHLKQLRLGRRWDQHQLAERARRFGVGITQSQISRYENGHEPAGRNALALANALEVRVEDLYKRDAAAADDDDEEAAHVAGSLDVLLRLRIREILGQEIDRVKAGS